MTTSTLRPTPEVERELREALRGLQSRLGDTYRGLEQGKTHREIADELGVPTHGFGYNNQASIETILEGRRSDSPVPTRVARSHISGLSKQTQLSPAAREYLQAVLVELDSQMAPSTGWDGFVQWAAILAEVVDVAHEEDAWKRASAARLASARERLLADDLSALDEARSAMARTGLLDRFFMMKLTDAVNERPQELADALLSIWQHDPREADLDSFTEQLQGVLGHVTPGNATAMGSVLLMGLSPSEFPPYRPTPAVTVRRLSEGAANEPESPARRYQIFLDWLDQFIVEASTRGLEIPDRLNAQGLAWTVAKTDPSSTSMSAELARDFLRWRGDAPEPQRAWLVRPAQGGPARWLAEGFVSLPATNLGEVEPGADAVTVKTAIENGYSHQDYAIRKSLTKEYHAFLTLMRPEDVVVVLSGDNIAVGTIASDPEYRDEPGYRLARDVLWEAKSPTETLAAPLPSLLDLQGNVVEITQGVAVLGEIIATGKWDPDRDGNGGNTTKETDPPVPPPDVVPRLPAVTHEVATRHHTSQQALQEIIDLLQIRQQIVLYGPPGTGKTYLALALARHIVGPEHRSRVQLVQFHPSYAYEDFVEGYRPIRTDEGQASFELQPGPLRRIAAEARMHPGEPYVLIIDELNRANLAKVFGELYFLLEYRDQWINLQYQPEASFSLPLNLFIIGTMNTADRSIALLDAAMRRRFSFIELHPDDEPVRSVLTNWLRANQLDGERARLLHALNSAIEEQDRDMRIGPSYLMRDEAGTEAGLARVWKHDILPLLEEHYYGRLSRAQLHARFGLAALRADLQGNAESDGDLLVSDDADAGGTPDSGSDGGQ